MQLSEELGRLLSNLGRRLSRIPMTTLSNLDYTTLVWLENRSLDGCRLSDLAEGRGYDVSTMSRRVAHLVESGLIERERDPGDGRAHRLRLSPAGRDVVAVERSRRVQLITETLDDWSAEDKSQLARLLGRLNHNLEINL